MYRSKDVDIVHPLVMVAVERAREPIPSLAPSGKTVEETYPDGSIKIAKRCCTQS